MTPGLLIGVGPESERNTGPSSGVGVDLAASGEGSVLAGSGVRAGFSTPGVPSAVGELAGKITTRGVAEAPGEASFSPGDGEGSVEGVFFSSSSECLLR
jgi:hypothetical protein